MCAIDEFEWEGAEKQLSQNLDQKDVDALCVEICEDILFCCPPITENNAHEVLRAHVKNFFAVQTSIIIEDAAFETFFTACYQMLCDLRDFKPSNH